MALVKLGRNFFGSAWSQNARNACLPTSSVMIMPTAGVKHLGPPEGYDWVEFPERRKLRVLDKVPTFPANMRAPKMMKNLRFMRGPELIHNEFLHKQYGIVATGPGRMRHGHFEVLRLTLGRFIDQDRMFAVWRIDPPWQSITKKGQGHRMGGGKGGIDHYITPIKAGRVIVEFGGKLEFAECKDILTRIANQMPFKAKAMSYDMMQKAAALRKWREENNINPYTYKYIVQNNLHNCHNWISPYDRMWFGEHI